MLSVLSLLASTLSLPIAPLPTMAPPACITMQTDRMPLPTRRSPLDSLSFKVGSADVKVCYGRPSLRGRKALGGDLVPFGQLWRTGANEPTMIHTTAPITIAGVEVPAGSYSLYTVPGPQEWDVIVNRSVSQWGHESAYTDEVRAKEVGHGKVKSEALKTPVEQFTISNQGTTLVLDWENTRVKIPLAAKR